MANLKNVKAGNLYRICNNASSMPNPYFFDLVDENSYLLTEMPNDSVIMFLEYRFDPAGLHRHYVKCIYKDKVGFIRFTFSWPYVSFTELTQ